MANIEVLTGSVGEGGRNDARDVKLVGSLLDDWWAREAGEPGGRPLPDGPMEPRTLAAIRALRAWSGADPNGRIEPGDPTWNALAAYHLAGVRSGRVRAENLAFVPLRRPGDPSLSEADWRAAFAVACGGCASGFERCRAPGLFAMGERRIEPTPGGTAPGFPARRG